MVGILHHLLEYTTNVTLQHLNMSDNYAGTMLVPKPINHVLESINRMDLTQIYLLFGVKSGLQGTARFKTVALI